MREAATIRSLWRLLCPSFSWTVVALALGGLSSLCEGIGITLFLPVMRVAARQTNPDNSLFMLPLFPKGAGERSLTALIALIFTLIVLKNALLISHRALTSFIEGKIGHRLRCRIFERLMNGSYSYWERRDPGKVLDTLANESWRASQSYNLLNGILLYACTSLIFTALLAVLSWRLTVVVVAGIGGISLILRLISRPARRAGENAVHCNADLGARMWDGVAGIRTIQALSLQPLKSSRFARASELVRESFLRLDLLSGSVQPASEILYAGLLLGILAWQLPYASSLPTTLVFLVLLFRLQPSLSNLHSCLVTLAGAAGSIRDVEELLAVKPSEPIKSGSIPCDRLQHGIDLHQVSFRYEAEGSLALDRLSVRVPARRITAIAGGSGAGKSTLVQLLCRFYDPTDGMICIDGVPLQNLDLESWRMRTALVAQDTHLFSTTIWENIAFGHPQAVAGDVFSAAGLAAAHEFIEQLPDGYHTNVGERGILLSGGQRQRIALARAFLRSADLLILDEATNALDIATEAQVMKSLRRDRAGRTTIIVAHRLNTILEADHVIVLDGGRVVEEGPPAVLAAGIGPFSILYGSRSSSATGAS
ncbi:MAG TPA: ABC transporter ATP-binding protein [Bryobacteraceae bacterium]|nr:ABC transporter ATP-binding protein [Bryobacteraceae bacterium]